MQTVGFDYFYGGESEQFAYYRIPRLLVTDVQFKNLSTVAKLLCGLMLDRTGLSIVKHWYDHRVQPRCRCSFYRLPSLNSFVMV